MALLETERLILRPFQKDDLDRLADLMGNAHFMRFSLGVFDRPKTESFLDKILGWDREGLPSQFAVAVRSGELLIGYCGFFHQLVEEANEIEIGYRLHPDYWNKGMATEAASAVRDHAFRDLKLPRVISLIHPRNAPSRRVAEKVGLRFERKAVFKTFPTEVFALTREQWLMMSGV